jgi:hypothetical protein
MNLLMGKKRSPLATGSYEAGTQTVRSGAAVLGARVPSASDAKRRRISPTALSFKSPGREAR